MRKKMLALLMCATMVLGTAATAFADVPDGDTYTAAGKVFTNASNFINEANQKGKIEYTIYKDLSGKTTDTWKVTKGNESWKMYDGDFAVKVTGDAGTASKITVNYDASYLQVATQDAGVIAAVSGSETAFDITNPSPAAVNGKTAVIPTSVILDDGKTYKGVIFATTAKNTKTYIGSTDEFAAADKATVYLLNKTEKIIGSVQTTSDVKNGTEVTVGNQGLTVYATADNITYVSGAEKDVFSKDGLYTVDGNEVYVKNAGTLSQTIYTVDADGYIESKYDADYFDTLDGVAGSGVAAKPSAFAYAAKAVSSSDADKTYYVVFDAHSKVANVDSVDLDTVAYALADGTLTSDAIAVKYTVYEAVRDQSVTGSSTKAITLKAVDHTASALTFTVDGDWLSRTGLNSKGAIAVYNLDNDLAYTNKDNKKLNSVIELGNATVENGKFTFTTTDMHSNVLVFDAGEEESNNDGVSEDTTTAAATTAAPAAETAATSPKTGDVAPIAALAVVMMGACGAMVVASKKRA
jgi:hypothetical protein